MSARKLFGWFLVSSAMCAGGIQLAWASMALRALGITGGVIAGLTAIVTGVATICYTADHGWGCRQCARLEKHNRDLTEALAATTPPQIGAMGRR